MICCFIEDLQKYGAEEAIMLYNFRFWIWKNKANEKHFHEGRYWTYNSKKAMVKIFPFWTERRIKTILDNLTKKGALLKGNFSDNKMDRTNWYSLVDGNVLMEKQFSSASIDENRPLNTDIIPDNNILNTKKENNKKKKSFSLEFADEVVRGIMEEWLIYRNEIGKPYKSDDSVKRCYENLLKLSNGDVEVMKKIVDQSISNAWQGLFPLKNYGIKERPVDNYW